MDIFSDEQAGHPDWARLLPREAFHEMLLVFRSALPASLADDAEDVTPEDWMRRDGAAMAAVVALRPANAAEGRLAAQFVAADAWALDCLRLAREQRLEMGIAHRCRAQAMSMMREAKSSLRLLLKLQAERRKMEADEAEALSAAPPAATAGSDAVSDVDLESHGTRRETEPGRLRRRPPVDRSGLSDAAEGHSGLGSVTPGLQCGANAALTLGSSRALSSASCS